MPVTSNARELAAKIAHFAADGVFNPYAQRCSVFDVPNAVAIRRKNLDVMLEAAAGSCTSIWVGRDLGYKGGRRTGLALTDDLNYSNHLARFGIEARLPVKPPFMSERTAAIVWHEIDKINEPIFFWNLFPYHPHRPDDPFSNRPHNAQERKAGLQILDCLVSMIKPHKIIAIGADAATACTRFESNLSLCQVRHPSYGGANIFRAQIRDIYEVAD